jgi:hypothetical protein
MFEATADPDGTFTVKAAEPVFLELLRDPQGSYRLSAEVCHRSTGKRALVGLYFANGQLPTPGASSEFCTLSFDDQGARYVLPDGTRRSRADVRVRQYRPADGVRFDCPVCAEHFPPANLGVGPHPYPWRHLAVEVTPQGIEAFWEGRTIGRVARPDLVQRFKQFRLMNEPAPVGEPPFGPRQSLGLYVSDGKASFRRVTVQPLR